MSERTIALLALVIAVIAIVGLAIHVVVPSGTDGPAHHRNRIWDAWQRGRMPAQSTTSSGAQQVADASQAGVAS